MICNFVARMLAVIGTLALSLMLGSTPASAADPIVGKTYSDAAATISKWNGTPVVATVSGSALALDNCIVTSWAQNIFLDTDGSNSRRKEYRLNLNCNNALAAPGHPGNSVMSPEGIQAKKDQVSAASIEKNSAACYKSEGNMNWCVSLCKRTGLCSVGSE